MKLNRISLETSLHVPRLSVKSCPHIQTKSRQHRHHTKSIRNRLESIPTIQQYHQTQTNSLSSFRELIHYSVESSNGQTETFHRKRKISEYSCYFYQVLTSFTNIYIFHFSFHSERKRLCSRAFCFCCCLLSCIIVLLALLIPIFIIFLTPVSTTEVTTTSTITTISTTETTTTTTSTITTSSTSTTTETTTLGLPTCSTCMISYTDNISSVNILGNLSCHAACQTTNYYKGSTVSFPSLNSFCNGIVTDLSTNMFCTFRLTYYYSSNNTIHYDGPVYGNYTSGPSTGLGDFNAYLARCLANTNYYCCCG